MITIASLSLTLYLEICTEDRVHHKKTSFIFVFLNVLGGLTGQDPKSPVTKFTPGEELKRDREMHILE